MKKILLLFTIVVTSLCPSESFSQVKGFYSFNMSVEKNGEKIENGIQMINEDTHYCAGVFTDESIVFKWGQQPTHMNVSIENRSDQTIKVDWNNSVYMNGNNSPFRIFHSGITIADRNSDQPPSLIIKGATLEDVVIPSANVNYSSYFGRWVYSYLLDYKRGSEDGETTKMMISIRNSNNEVTEYLFLFDLKYNKAKVKTRIIGGLSCFI